MIMQFAGTLQQYGSSFQSALSGMQGALTFPPPPQGEDDDEEKQPDSYVGNLDEGTRSGKGKYTWSDGTVYEGPYVNGAKHGEGKLTFADGSHYQGAATDPAMPVATATPHCICIDSNFTRQPVYLTMLDDNAF